MPRNTPHARQDLAPSLHLARWTMGLNIGSSNTGVQSGWR